MKILLGSLNPAKKYAVEQALKTLNIKAEILCYGAKSNVSSKPIGYEIIRGAVNRNLELKNWAKENNINYDFLCSIEGGFALDENGLPFVTTYAVVEDITGKNSTGKSLGVRLKRSFYEQLRAGKSLNEYIEKITGKTNNKKSAGIMGFLSNGILNREIIDSQAVLTALIPFVFKDNYQALANIIEKDKLK